MPVSTKFIEFVEGLLRRGLTQKSVHYLLYECEDRDRYLEEIKRSFRHDSVSEYNYEVDEHLGDAVLKHITVKYIDTRYADQKLSISVRSSLSQKMYAKSQLSDIATELGFSPYIEADVDVADNVKEDIFEAFLGAVEKIVDDVWGMGSGYKCLYNLMKTFWDTKDFDVSEDAVVAKKTQVKQAVWDNLGWKTNLIDAYNKSVGNRVLLEFNAISDSNQLKIYWNKPQKKWEFFGEAKENHRREKSPDYQVYKISSTYTPEAALIAWAGDVKEQDALQRCFEIALEVYKEIGVFKLYETPAEKVMFGNMLPAAYQTYVRERREVGKTYWNLVAKNGLVQMVASRLPNGPQPIDSLS